MQLLSSGPINNGTLVTYMLEPANITSCPTTQEYYSAGCSSTNCSGTSAISHVHLRPCMDRL
jgi:hypothetical protein